MSQRCGWCITGDHQHCVVVVEMGTKHKNGFSKHLSSKDRNAGIYPWNCKCGCEYSLNTKCVDCQRVGVTVVKNRCVADCSSVKVRPRPRVREVFE